MQGAPVRGSLAKSTVFDRRVFKGEHGSYLKAPSRGNPLVFSSLAFFFLVLRIFPFLILFGCLLQLIACVVGVSDYTKHVTIDQAGQPKRL